MLNLWWIFVFRRLPSQAIHGVPPSASWTSWSACSNETAATVPECQWSPGERHAVNGLRLEAIAIAVTRPHEIVQNSMRTSGWRLRAHLPLDHSHCATVAHGAGPRQRRPLVAGSCRDNQTACPLAIKGGAAEGS